MSSSRQYRFLTVLVCLLGLSGIGAWAQTVRGSLAGNITDSSGAAIPDAAVSATNEASGVAVNTQSTSAGSYRFTELPLGKYDVTVTKQGFQKNVQTGVLVTLGTTSSLNIIMAIGTEATTVTVDASAPTVQTQSSDVGGTVQSRQIVQLPLALGGVGALRSSEAFEFLLPGTTGPGTANSNNGIFLSKISGGQEYGNEVLLDGADQQRSENGSSFDEEGPSVEALQEFRITTAIPEAQYGRSTGGFENFVTKSGTNSFHGTVFDITRNEAMDANTWFNNGLKALNCSGANNTPACRNTYRTPSDKQFDYGGSLGGPVSIPHLYNGKDKLFFFFSWEQFQQKLGATQISTVPTVAMRNGDFSSTAIYRTDLPSIGTNPCDGTPIYQGEIFDPATQRTVALPNGSSATCRTQFPGNIIPAPRFSAVAKNFLNFYPPPTNSSQFNNFDFPSTIPLNNTTMTIRIDANPTQKNKLFFSYSSRENNRTSGGNPLLPYPQDPNTWKQDFTTHFIRIGWDYTLSPTMLNHLIVGYNRSNSVNYAFPIFNAVDYAQKFGLANSPQSFNFPQVTTGNGIVNLGNPAQNDDNVDNGIRVFDSVNIEKGRHSIQTGVDYRIQQYSPINNPSPSLNFSNVQTTSDPTQNQLGGNGFASFLLGAASGGNFGPGLYSEKPRWTSFYIAGYLQDNLKVSNTLTLNLGVRYDVDVPRQEAHNATSNFSPTAVDPAYGIPGALVFGTTCHCNTRWADTYFKDIAPRIGFAYSPANTNGKTVFRGGGAIFYGPLQYSDFGGSMDQGYKVAPSFVSQDGFSPAFNIDNGYPGYQQPPDLRPGFFNGQPVAGSYIMPQYGKPAAVYEWSLQMQQQVAQDLILSVGYLGNKAQNLRSNVQNINNISLNDFALGDQLSAPFVGNTAGVGSPYTGFLQTWGPGVQLQRALRPFPQYDYIDSGCCLQNVGMSTYNALLVSLARQYRNGLTLQVSYTWAKDLTDADSALPNNGVAVSQVQNPFNLHMEKAISAQDIRNTFVISPLYQLPFGKGRKWMNSGIAGTLLGGWDIGGVLRYESGQPISFCCATGAPGFQNSFYYSRVPGRSFASPAYLRGHLNPLGNGNSGVTDDNVNSYFAPTIDRDPVNGAFFDPNQNTYRGTRPNGTYVFGDVPRVEGEVRTQGYYNEDLSILKNFPIKEGVNFVLKGEFLNAFNRHAFAIPGDLNPNDNNFGIPTSTVTTPRNLQITGRITF